MLKWVHEVSSEWMQARRNVITATELCSLRSKTATAKKMLDKNELHPDFCYVYESKTVDNQDTVSFNDAARGHCLEPYAIKEFNKYNQFNENVEHWDDCIITNGDVGWSPDGTNVNQWILSNDASIEYSEELGITKAYEVKCYGVKKHVEKLVVDPGKFDERYQIAAAMLICPSITSATLIFYNPNCKHHIIWYDYYRDDLIKEIEQLQETLDVYRTITKMYEEDMPYLEHIYQEDLIHLATQEV